MFDNIDELVNEATTVIPRFFKYTMKFQQKLLEDTDISKSHLQIMFLLKNKDKITMSQIGKILLISKPNVTTLVDKLVALDYVSRCYDDEDRRIIYIYLTQEGIKFLENYVEKYKILLKEKFQKLPDEELKLLSEIIEKMSLLLDNLE